MDRWIRLEKANIFVHVRTSVFIHAYIKVLMCFLFLVTLLWIYDWGLSMKLHSQFQHMAFCSLFTMWLKVKSFFWRGIFSLLYTTLGCFFWKANANALNLGFKIFFELLDWLVVYTFNIIISLCYRCACDKTVEKCESNIRLNWN